MYERLIELGNKLKAEGREDDACLVFDAAIKCISKSTKLKSEIGNKYGLLTVISRAENIKGRTRWNCQCDCGKSKDSVSARSLRTGNTISCGCQHNGRKASSMTSPKIKAQRKKYYKEYKMLDIK